MAVDRVGRVMGPVAVVGAGAWGTTLASIAALSAPTVLWARDPALAEAIAVRHENPAYFPGVPLSEALRATSSLGEALAGAELVVMAVPSHGFRSVLTAAAPFIEPGTPVLSLTKGLERESHLRMSEVVQEVLPGSPVGVLTGPSLAEEVLAGSPAAIVVASVDEHVAAEVQRLFFTGGLRVYTSTDVIGCEIAGAAKNVLAIAAGVSDGLGLGDNTRAALVTRGLAELGRLVVALGGDRSTVHGLAGIGDLVATFTSPKSRNRSLGEALGRGGRLSDLVDHRGGVAEGVRTARPLVELARSRGVEMPIAEQVADLLEGRLTPLAAIDVLMGRPARAEVDDGHRPAGDRTGLRS